MKTKIVFRLLILVVLVITTQKITAQDPPGVGIGTNNPTGALLHVANPDSIAMPSLRLDSIPTYSTGNVTYFLAIDTGGRIVGKVSIDSIVKKKPEMVPANNICYGSNIYYPLYNNSDNLHIVVTNSTTVCFYSEAYGLQKCSLDTLLGYPGALSLNLSGACIINGNVYLLIRGYVSSIFQMKVIKLPISSFNHSSRQEMIFTGGALDGTSHIPYMSGNGNYLYFNYNGGYAGSNNLIAKYQISGGNLNKITTITLSSTIASYSYFHIKDDQTIWISDLSANPLKVFDQTGSIIKTYPFNYYLQTNSINWNNTFYWYANGLLHKLDIF
jgi:hypothetical protein